MLEQIRKFASPTRRNEEGASAVEYGLLVALIAAVVVVAVVALGGLVKSTFEDTCSSIGAESAAAGGEDNCDAPATP
jgi:pilus assembly protein Flp/PilA